MIEAKPVIANRYWILKKDDRKIGTVEADNQGFSVTVENQVSRFKTIPMVRKNTDIDFQPEFKTTKPQRDQVYGYVVGCRAFNIIWDVQRRIPLFTKMSKSKSQYAAGWFQIQQHKKWKVIRNPKLITLDRYKFVGPFHTQEQANV